jgi:hypothetical protein
MQQLQRRVNRWPQCLPPMSNFVASMIPHASRVSNHAMCATHAMLARHSDARVSTKHHQISFYFLDAIS